MKRNLIALAIAGAIAAPLTAAADTTLYGKLHLSTDFYGGDNAANNNYALSSNSSRIGIRGSEAINANLNVIYQWETTMGWGDGSGGDGGFGGQRNTFAGFSGDWGRVLVGRMDTPFKGVRSTYGFFGDQVGDARTILDAQREDGTRMDRRASNSIAYSTPDLAGFSATLQYSADTSGGTDNDQDLFSARADYKVAGFSITAAYDQNNRNGDDQSAWRLGAGYSFGDFEVAALYQDAEIGFDGDDQTAWGFGGAYSIGDGTFKAQYYTADSISNRPATGADMWAVGYDYSLSRQTKLYAAFQYVSNDSGTDTYNVGGGGHGKSPAQRDNAFGDDYSVVSFGVEHSF